MKHQGRDVKMIVEAISTYTPKRSDANGITDNGEFGNINILTGTDVKLKFSFKAEDDDSLIILERVFLTIYDIGNNVHSFVVCVKICVHFLTSDIKKKSKGDVHFWIFRGKTLRTLFQVSITFFPLSTY